VAGSKQQEEILESQRKASEMNDDEGIAKESIACLKDHLTWAANRSELLIKEMELQLRR